MCQERQGDLDYYEENPFNTICHNDLWVNNVMIAYDDRGKPTRVKIFDFQLIMYASLSIDVLFFLFTSVQNDILLEHFEYFLKFYFDEFCKSLKYFGCSLDDFTWEKYWNNWWILIKFYFVTYERFYFAGSLRTLTSKRHMNSTIWLQWQKSFW